MRVVAAEAFKINVRPSTNFQRMLAAAAACAPSSTSLSFSGERGAAVHAGGDAGGDAALDPHPRPPP